MKLLVTGAAGFIGAHLCRRLRARFPEWEVEGLDLREARNGERLGFSGVDVVEVEAVTRVLDEVAPDGILNLCGSYTNDFEVDFRNNVGSTRALCEALVSRGAPRIPLLVLGSSAEYGPTPVGQAVDETAPLEPLSVYGLTKAMQWQVASFFTKQRGLDVRTARAFNLLGPGASPRILTGLLSQQIRRFRTGESKTIRIGSPGEDERDFLDVRDLCDALLEVLLHGQSGEVYNVGSGRATRVSLITQLVLRAAQIPEEAVDFGPPRGLSKLLYQRADVAKASQDLGWTAKIGIEESVKRLVGATAGAE